MKKILNAIFELVGLKLFFLQNLPLGFDITKDINNHFDGYTAHTIIDVGANIGQSSIFFKNAYPSASIYSLEPVQQTFKILDSALSKYDQVKTFQLALGARNEIADIQIKENSLWNSLVDHESGNGKKEKIEVITLDELVSREEINRISILKIDVEGFEVQVLKGGEETFKNGLVDFVYCEVGLNENDRSHTFFLNVKTELEKNGFRFVSFYNSSLIGQNGHFSNALFFNSNILTFN